jgi:hypothetical protein
MILVITLNAVLAAIAFAAVIGLVLPSIRSSRRHASPLVQVTKLSRASAHDGRPAVRRAA